MEDEAVTSASQWASRLDEQMDSLQPFDLRELYQRMIQHNDKFIVPFCAKEGLNNLLSLVYKHLENADMLHNIITIIRCIMDCTVTTPQSKTDDSTSGGDSSHNIQASGDDNENEDDAMVLVNTMSVVENDDVGLPLGYEIIASHASTIPTILDMFDNKDVSVRTEIIKLLTVICWGTEDGFFNVTEAMKAYSVRSNGTTIFDEFVRAVYFEKSIEFRGHVLRLINGLLNSLESLNERIEARYALSDLGFVQIIEEMKTELNTIDIAPRSQKSKHNAQNSGGSDDSAGNAALFMTRQRSFAEVDDDETDHIETTLGVGNGHSPYNSGIEDSDSDSDQETTNDADSIIPVLAEQIRLYEKRSSDDDLECMYESVNLSDADGMFSFLLKKSVQEGHHQQLMNILACLAVIPRHSRKTWSLISSVMLQATVGIRKNEFLDLLKKTENESSPITAQYERELKDVFQSITEESYPSMQEIRILLEKYSDESYDAPVAPPKTRRARTGTGGDSEVDKPRMNPQSSFTQGVTGSLITADELETLKQEMGELRRENIKLRRKTKVVELTRRRLASVAVQHASELPGMQDHKSATYASTTTAPGSPSTSTVVHHKTQTSIFSIPTPLLTSLLDETEAFNEYDDDNNDIALRKRSLSPKMATTTLTPESGNGAAFVNGSDAKRSKKQISFNVAANVESHDVDTSQIAFAEDDAKPKRGQRASNANAPTKPLPARPPTTGAPAPAPAAAPAPAPAAAAAAPPLPAAQPLNAAPMPAPIAIAGAAPLPSGVSPSPSPAAPPLPGLAAPPAAAPPAAAPPAIPGLPVLSPPPMVGGKNDKKKINPRVPMKNLHWDSIKNRNEKNATVWKFINDEKIDIDKDSLESSFRKKGKKKKKKKGGDGADGDGGSSKKGKKEAPQTISLLEAKRAYNVSIGLSRMRMDNMALKAAILAMDDKELGLEKINSLLNFVPTSEEQELVKAYDGDPKLLEMAESFFYALRHIDGLHERLELWAFQISFPVIMKESEERIGILKQTYEVVKKNESFKFMLCYVLAIGNYMNGGTKKGQAYGFKLGLLEQLESTKATDPNLPKRHNNLLFYIVSTLESKEEYSKKAFGFLTEFDIINDALTVDIDQLTSEVKLIGSNLDKIWKKLDDATHEDIQASLKKGDNNGGDDNKTDDSNGKNKHSSENSNDEENEMDEADAKDKMEDENSDLFSSVMGDFYGNAYPSYQVLSNDMNDIVGKCSELGRFFGEKDDTKMEFLNMIQLFRENVTRVRMTISQEKEQAIKEQKAKEKAEQAQKDKTKKKSKKEKKSSGKSSKESRKSGKAKEVYDKIKNKSKKKKKKKKSKKSKGKDDENDNENEDENDMSNASHKKNASRIVTEGRGRGMTFSDKVLSDINIDSVKQREAVGQHLRRNTKHFKKRSVMEMYLEAKSSHGPSKSGNLPPILDDEVLSNPMDGTYNNNSGSSSTNDKNNQRHSANAAGLRGSRKVPPPPTKDDNRPSRPRPNFRGATSNTVTNTNNDNNSSKNSNGSGKSGVQRKKLTLTITGGVASVNEDASGSNKHFSDNKSTGGLAGISAMMAGLSAPQKGGSSHERRSSRWRIESEDTPVVASAQMSGLDGSRRRRAPPQPRKSWRQ